jgi:hypothetical protein
MSGLQDFVRSLDKANDIRKQNPAVCSSLNEVRVSLKELLKALGNWPSCPTDDPASDHIPDVSTFPDYSNLYLMYATVLGTGEIQTGYDRLLEQRRITQLSRKRYAEVQKLKATVGVEEVLNEAIKLRENLARLHYEEVEFATFLVNQWRAMLQSTLII